MPSITGIWISVSSRSKPPFSLLKHIQRLGAVGGWHDVVAVLGERARDQRAQRFLVLGDQDARQYRLL